MTETTTAADEPTTAAPQRLTTTRIHLARRPVGEPRPDDLELVRVEIDGPGPDQVLVRNRWMSVDPYMRNRMNDAEDAIPPFALGGPLDGAAVGTVVASRSDAVAVGATVLHDQGWREHAVLDAATVAVVPTGTSVPEQAHLGVLGTPGLTAWISLTETAPVREGDVVFVSAAAGAVGTVAGQLARRLGASRVIGSAGGPEKGRRLVEEFGYDRALDRRAGPIGDQLAEAAPDGVDVYLDAVGGDHLEAAVEVMRVGGRIALVGGIGGYNATAPRPGPANLFRAVGQRITLRGMFVGEHFGRWDEWRATAIPWLLDGSLRTAETVHEGLTAAPGALIGVLRGENTGKMLVRLG